jgi:hypothetical protein
MFQARCPAGRLFFLVLAVVVAASGIRLAAGGAVSGGKAEKPANATPVKAAIDPAPRAATPAPQSGPALTSVVDTVYMADGIQAQGILVITWPAFVAADGAGVAAGSLDVTLGTNGALNVALVPNAGANPANTYYTVVYQLQPSEVRTEYWVVPTSSPATLAEVRTTPGSGTAAQPVSMQYVNTALAAKANDNAVVHLAGAETVTGTKSFTVPPNVPTPVGTGDVTNKAYVDAAIATVGAGNYLPTAGGAMTGPLTLSGNPTAPLQAAAKEYVDSAAAAKANLVSGLVPTNELGSGAASALNCLLGNGTWGSCGSSANATEIQSVPVGSTAPANGQVLMYSTSLGQYSPATPSGGSGGVSVSPAVSQNVVQPGGTALTANNFNNITYSVPSYNWSQSPAGTIGVGSNTVALTPCPIGLAVSSFINAQTYVYISGVGTSEAVLITSTTCAQAGGASGTITFTAANTHGSGYTIGSASQGVQEAINAASYVSSTSTASELGSVVIPPGQYAWQARVTVSSPGMVLDFSGAVITCTMADSCLFVGSTAHPTSVWDVTIKKFTGQAACNDCNYPMIEDAGQHTKLTDIQAVNPNPLGSVSSGSSFGSLIQVDNDQSAVIDSIDTNNARWYHCTTAFCSVAVKGTGGSGNSGILWIKNSNLSLSCGANGVDNQNANTMRISDSVIQAQAQFGVRATASYGNTPSVELDNTYFEVGGCANLNPLGIGIAGLIVEGGFASVKNTVGPVGSAPVFANTGSAQYNYYVVAHSSTYGASAPFLAGIALTNGSGSIPVAWPQFGASGTITYDVIRTSGTANLPAPYTANCTGGSTTTCGSVATGLTVASACSAVGSTNICSFSDTASTNTASYTVASPPTFWPALPFWNGSVIYTTSGDAVGIGPVLSGVHFDRLGDNVANLGTNPVSQLVSSFGALVPKFFAQHCNATYGGAWLSCVEHTEAPIGATLLDSGTYNFSDNPGLKGRLIFEEGLYGTVNGGHKITLADSNPAKTLATGGMRPSYDANDTYIGLDNTINAAASNARLAFGAPVSISNYIGNAGDNVSFLERLTSSAKTFNVPVNINGNLTVTGTCTGCGGGGGAGTVNSGTATQVALYAANGTAVSGDSGLTDSGSTLNYSGSNGISAAAGTFGGNVTVNGQLLVAGPWMVSSPIPGTAMPAAGAGTSALGISNDGNFYISANAGTPQKVATTATSSYFSNLFQEDANDLGEYNGATPQNLHVYSSYTNSSTWLRTSVGYDAADSYAVVRSESSPSGSAPGLGFWINNVLKWVVDASSNFKPWTDQGYNIGTFNSGSGTGLRPGTVYVAGNSTSGSGLELGKFANESYELCNDSSTGTIVNGLAVLSSAGCAIKPASALTSGAIGVVIANAGTTGVTTLARAGSVYCSFDGTATVVGDYVVPSSTASSSFYPLCHDAGATRPAGTQILGRVLQASAGSTTVQMFLDMPGSNVSSGASAGTGSCTNQAVTAVLTGGPTCTTITSAYVDSSIATSASAALTGTPTAPTAALNTNTTQVATTAFVLGQASSTTPNVDGTAAVGTSNTFARADHVHPTDTTRAPLASPALTGTPTAPTATAGDNSTKIATTAYVRSEIDMAWSCAVAGTTSVIQNCNWTLPAGITVTGFDLAASTAAVGCTTYPVLQVWDGTAGAEVGSYSMTFTTGTNFYTQVTGSTNVTSGHQLRFKITTAAAGCTTSAAGIVATVTYQMQN